jgi:hypothetical protein
MNIFKISSMKTISLPMNGFERPLEEVGFHSSLHSLWGIKDLTTHA